MSFKGKVEALTIDHQKNTFDVTEELILLGQDYAFVKKDNQTIGMVCLDDLLNTYHAKDESKVSIQKFINPLLKLSIYGQRSKEGQQIEENSVEHFAVFNEAGELIGIISN